MKKYDTIIFDMDGTLLNTLEDLTDAINYTMKKHGHPERTLDEVKSFVGNGIQKLVRSSLPRNCSEAIVEASFRTFKEYYSKHSRIKTTPYYGVVELLKNLKQQNYKMAIVSNKNYEVVKELTLIYFGNLIEVAIGEREDIKRKPAPDSVLNALKELGSQKERAVYVGDTEVDRATATNAELDCILVSWGYREEDVLKKLKPMKIIHNPMELINII